MVAVAIFAILFFALSKISFIEAQEKSYVAAEKKESRLSCGLNLSYLYRIKKPIYGDINGDESLGAKEGPMYGVGVNVKYSIHSKFQPEVNIDYWQADIPFRYPLLPFIPPVKQELRIIPITLSGIYYFLPKSYLEVGIGFYKVNLVRKYYEVGSDGVERFIGRFSTGFHVTGFHVGGRFQLDILPRITMDLRVKYNNTGSEFIEINFKKEKVNVTGIVLGANLNLKL